MSGAQHSGDNDAHMCEAPRCREAAVERVPDSTEPPRYWYVCPEHLRVIRPARSQP